MGSRAGAELGDREVGSAHARLAPGLWGIREPVVLSAAPWLPSSTTLTFLIWSMGLVTVPPPQGHHHRTVRCAASQAILGAGGGAGSPRQVGPG